MSTNWHNPSDIGLVTSLLPAGSVTSIGQSDGSPDITVVSLDGFLNTYKALYEEHQSLVSNREQLKAHYDERGKASTTYVVQILHLPQVLSFGRRKPNG